MSRPSSASSRKRTKDDAKDKQEEEKPRKREARATYGAFAFGVCDALLQTLRSEDKWNLFNAQLHGRRPSNCNFTVARVALYVSKSAAQLDASHQSRPLLAPPAMEEPGDLVGVLIQAASSREAASSRPPHEAARLMSGHLVVHLGSGSTATTAVIKSMLVTAITKSVCDTAQAADLQNTQWYSTDIIECGLESQSRVPLRVEPPIDRMEDALPIVHLGDVEGAATMMTPGDACGGMLSSGGSARGLHRTDAMHRRTTRFSDGTVVEDVHQFTSTSIVQIEPSSTPCGQPS